MHPCHDVITTISWHMILNPTPNHFCTCLHFIVLLLMPIWLHSESAMDRLSKMNEIPSRLSHTHSFSVQKCHVSPPCNAPAYRYICQKKCGPFELQIHSISNSLMILSPLFYPSALSASADTSMMLSDVQHLACGITNTMFSLSVLAHPSTPNQASSSVPSGSRQGAAPTYTMYAQAVSSSPMEPNAALKQRILSMPKADAWKLALYNADLFLCFVQVPSGLCNSFLVDFPLLSISQCPPNKDSVLMYIGKFQKDNKTMNLPNGGTCI